MNIKEIRQYLTGLGYEDVPEWDNEKVLDILGQENEELYSETLDLMVLGLI